MIQHARKEGMIDDTFKMNIKLFISSDRKQKIIEATTNETIKHIIDNSENIKNENIKVKPIESNKKRENTFTIIIFDENNNKCLKTLNIDENNLIIDSEKKIK